MTNVLLMDAATAAEVRGPSSATPLSHLDPVPLTDGRFYVNESVRDDPLNADHYDTLAACEVVDFATLVDLLPPSE
jgi:hypothetical protein